MKIADTHNDFLTELDGKDLIKYMKECKNNGVCHLSCSFFSTKQPENTIFQTLQRKSKLLRYDSNIFKLHIEDLFFVKTFNQLNTLLALKPFSCSLTWNNQNALGGGTYTNKPLTSWGEIVVKSLEHNNVLVDCAHLSKNAFWHLCNVSSRPIFCSHTGFTLIKNHPRNLNQKQIKHIISTNGFVGMFFFKPLSIKNNQTYNARQMAQNLAEFSHKFGSHCLGIGSDYFGISSTPQDLKNYLEFENLKDQMHQIGFDNKEIENILHNNFERFKKSASTIR